MEIAGMSLNKLAKQLVSALLDDGRIWDDNAETVAEMAEKLKLSPRATSDRLKKKLAEGKIEKVWKRVNNIPCQAYRLKR